MSPFDVPQRVSGRYDDKQGRFVIDFSYLVDDEPKEEVEPDNEHFSLLIGKRSGCLYRVAIDVDEIGADVVSVTRVLDSEEIDRLAGLAKDHIETFAKAKRLTDDRQRQFRVAGEAIRELTLH